ncbi:unnamed protein product [Symbiodinium sp. CCMP2592]|nr:unnamed protein product [Symbiodinium sp. CCMP2592]
MSAVDLSAGGGFAQLARAFVDIQAQEFLPVLPAVGVHDLRGALDNTGALLLAGVPEEVLLRLGAWRPAPESSSRAPAPSPAESRLALPPGEQGIQPAAPGDPESAQVQPVRADIPVRRDGRRACKRTALQAALPELQAESLADLDGAIMARSSEGPFRSRVRTWVDFTAAWALPAWPISLDSVRKVAASMRKGRYRSAQNYFDAAVTYQEHFRGELVDPLVRRAIRRYAKAVVRGLAGSKLKAIFPAMRLEPLLDPSPASAAEPWAPWKAAHSADALLLAVWFMLREIEFAAARTEDMEAGEDWVLLRIPLHKTAQGGERELTARQLRCACGIQSRPMCPAHAALRHVSRLKAAGLWVRGGPLFPDTAGNTWAKGETVLLFRRVLLAAGVALTTVDHEGQVVQLFAGHSARVAGAAWLASKGVPTAIIQLLGRWSSTAVERYVQAAPLAVAPEIPGRVLAGSYGGTQATDEARRATAGDAAEPDDQAEFSPAVLLVDAPPRGPAPGGVGHPPAREDLIYNEKGAKVHRPDPAEATTEQFLWRSRCGAWPYGIRRFFRVSEKPASAAWCARCFPAPAPGEGEGSPTEPVDSPVASSSASESDSSSS